ncbi:MAG: SDR family oxidoreductase, partial [Rhodothermales bacterium]
SGMTWTVLQPGGFMEITFSQIAGWDMEKGKVRVVGSGRTPRAVISLYDVAEFAVTATHRPEMRDRSIPLGGPEALTVMDAVKVFEEATGQKLKVAHVPVAVLKIASVVLRPFNPPLSTILTFASSERPDVIDMAPVLSEFPVKLTSLREFAARSAGASHAR